MPVRIKPPPRFWVSWLWLGFPRCNLVASFAPGDTTLTTGRTRRRWREESGGDTSSTTIMWCGLCWPSSLFPLERAGLSECHTSSCSAADSLFPAFTPGFFSGYVQSWPLRKETYQMWITSQWFMNSFSPYKVTSIFNCQCLRVHDSSQLCLITLSQSFY